MTAKPLVFKPHDNGLNRPHWQALVGEHMALYEIRDLAAFNPDTPPDSRFSLFSHLSRVSSWHATLAAAEVAGQADWQAFVCAVVEETSEEVNLDVFAQNPGPPTSQAAQVAAVKIVAGGMGLIPAARCVQQAIDFKIEQFAKGLST